MRALGLVCLLISLMATISCSKQKHTLVQGYIEGQFIYLSSSVSGILKLRLIDRGNPVKANQLLFSLDPEPESDNLEQASAKLRQEQESLANLIRGQRSTVLAAIIAQRDQASADLTYASQTLQRYRKLYRVAAISKDQLDQAEADYRAKSQLVSQYQANLAEAKLGSREHLILEQQAAVDAALADVKKNRWQLEQKTAYAPSDGIIFDTFFKAGEYVPAGQAVTALITADNVKLIFFIPEPLRSRLHLGETVDFHCDGCAHTKATINFLSDRAEYTPPVIYSRESRMKLVYRVECTIPPERALSFHAGQPVDVLITYDK